MIVISLLIAQQTTPKPGGGMFLLPALMVGMIVFMLLTSRSQKRRERREREEMHARMARNDRVVTIGGAIGTVVAVKEDEVILKVDESTNTKMTFQKSAIQRILSEEGQAIAGKK